MENTPSEVNRSIQMEPPKDKELAKVNVSSRECRLTNCNMATASLYTS